MLLIPLVLKLIQGTIILFSTYQIGNLAKKHHLPIALIQLAFLLSPPIASKISFGFHPEIIGLQF